MIFSYNWLQSLIKDKLPKPEKLAELLTMHSFEVNEVREGKEGKDWILDIDVLPNRMPDCASHIGIARECCVLTNSKFKIQNSKLIQNSKFKIQNFLRLEVQDKTDCLRYMARVVTDIKVGPSPKWIQERLQICGLRPINNVVDVVNYIMLETGQPLHAFDLDKLSGAQDKKQKFHPAPKILMRDKIKNIIVRRAKKGEKITTLDGDIYDLDEDILIIADPESPLAIAGIKGGKKAEIDDKTKNIVLESANFNPLTIRRGTQKLNLKTDASLRFEHGLDPNLAEVAINRAAELIADLAGGNIAQGTVDFYPQKVAPKKIKLDLEYTRRLLGVNISDKEIKYILERLGLKIENWKLEIAIVVVPTWRLDINFPEDLVEEIGRLYGYEKIPAKFPSTILIPPKRNDDILWEDKARNILKEVGMTEVYNYSFVSEKDMSLLGYGAEELFEVENPMSQEQKYLRPSLIPNLLKNIEKNQHSFSEIKIFELGKVFCKNKEFRALTGVISGDNFYEAKGIVDRLFQGFGIADIWCDEYKPTPELSHQEIWQKGKSAEIKSGRDELGFLGQIAPKIQEAYGIKRPVIIFDLDFEKLQKLATEEYIYQPVSKYPSAVRDIAVLVPLETRVIEVFNVINYAGGELVRDVDLFDIYEGEEIPAGKRNFAFHIVYQADDHTLSSKEIEALHKKIISALEENPDWEVRK